MASQEMGFRRLEGDRVEMFDEILEGLGQNEEGRVLSRLISTSVRKRPVRRGLRSRVAGLGFFGGRPGRTLGHSPALPAYMTGPGPTVDLCRLLDICRHLQISTVHRRNVY
ncbi:hypothetical protein HOY80DRAFT_1034626 [Tuber brumale]|nr:hypothetical protein HOY80DRAFT_1034626 [Tuber brumale]